MEEFLVVTFFGIVLLIAFCLIVGAIISGWKVGSILVSVTNNKYKSIKRKS